MTAKETKERHTISFRIHPELKQQFVELVATEYQSITSIMIQLIKEWIVFKKDQQLKADR